MKFAGGGPSRRCSGDGCMWYVKMITGTKITHTCAVAAGLLSIQLDKTGVFFNNAYKDSPADGGFPND